MLSQLEGEVGIGLGLSFDFVLDFLVHDDFAAPRTEAEFERLSPRACSFSAVSIRHSDSFKFDSRNAGIALGLKHTASYDTQRPSTYYSD